MAMREVTLSDLLSEGLDSLELPGVLEEVAFHALSAPGRNHVLASVPEDDPRLIQQSLALVSEIRETVGLDGPFGLAGLLPMEGILRKVEAVATILDAEEILIVADLLSISEAMMDRLEELEPRFELLRGHGAEITPLGILKNAISRVLDEHGAVRPTASARLGEIHHRSRSVRTNIKSRLEGFVNDRDLARVVQEDYVTMRNDRYVILLKPEFKGLLDGIVHDHSRSGASVYVEPFQVVEFNNQIASLADEEREEIRRIFRELTGEIRSALDVLLANYRILAFLDAFQARALYAREVSAVAPELVDEGFSILGARHPLLLASGDLDVVPMDVIQDSVTRATVISGANMGGKTVALKIAGLFPLMTRCGIMVPALEGTKICPFTRVMADIGEEQDIRGRVSSFSGHMRKIAAIVHHVSGGDLVLLDELGSATDPDEGAALAMAVIDSLADRGARVVVTTHLTHLKAYAFGQTGVRNVSVEFHPETLKPTYRLLYDLPGESHAIATAERIGLAPEVVEAARNYMDLSGGGSSRLLESLRQKIADVDLRIKDLEEERRVLRITLEEARTERETAVEDLRKAAGEMMRRAEKQIADLQQALKSGAVKKGQKAREVVEHIKKEIVHTLGVPLERRAPVLEVGSRVRVKSLGREGTVKSVRETGRVEIAVGKMTITADSDDVVLLGQGQGKKSSSKKDRIGVEIPLATPRWEINVIGLRVDEALPIVEKALDEALLGGLSSMTIIHGKGTGRLRKAVWEYLSGHSLVLGFRPGDMRGGGDGVTVVDLVSE
jgi:DNA mismatch repair protein MutS2